MFGRDASNTANQSSETAITTSSVSSLSTKWIFTTQGDVSARAAVVNGVVYFPDWGGYLHAVKASTGAAVWSKPLSAFGLPSPTHARSTPAVVNGTLYIGTQDGAWLLAIDAATGNLIWKTQLESPANDPFAIISTSPVVVGGTVFTGVASLEEAVAANPLYQQCCRARGSVVAVNANTGVIKWKTYTVPPGYSGGGVWGATLLSTAARSSSAPETITAIRRPTRHRAFRAQAMGPASRQVVPRRPAMPPTTTSTRSSRWTWVTARSDGPESW
jgi:polyvinyl alcohol dehydrogenase (cytochrome)